MRFRAGPILFVLSLIAFAGCRKPLAPNADRNLPPETWITAAPQDTITERVDGVPVKRDRGTIAVRFHLYWAGSDRDGAIAGFYYAVVETVPVAPPGLPPAELPGPKPRDYRFTTKTDSVMIFNVSEFRPDREHAFYIYAVDDKGKPDATPARFIFNALDRFPPNPYIYEAIARGRIYRTLSDRSILAKDTTIFIVDSLTTSNFSDPPRDTIPSTSELTFRWRGEPAIRGTYITGFKYKLDDPQFISVPIESTSKIYPLGTLTPGPKLFTLRVLDQAGGANEANRRFQMNYSPDTWFAGPDPTRFPREGVAVSRWDKSVLRGIPELNGTLLSSDSLGIMPSERPQRPTFFEIYKDRIYVRSEGDTVDMNSWLLFHAGGSDLDSPYNVAVSLNDPALADTEGVDARVLRPGPANGSPIGFQYIYTKATTPNGRIEPQSLSGLLPVFDAARYDHAPAIGAYVPAVSAGQYFLTIKSVDGDGALDKRIKDARRAVLDGIPDNPSLRSRVITFFVDTPPRFDFSRADFVPRPDTTFFTRTNIKFNLHALDDDPFDLENRPTGVGGPSTTTVLRWSVTLRGKNDRGIDTTYAPPGGYRTNHPDLNLSIPDWLVSEDLYAEIELCDCADCELQEGSGRCINLKGPTAIHFRVPPPAPSLAPDATPGLLNSSPRPGLIPSTGRSKP